MQEIGLMQDRQAKLPKLVTILLVILLITSFLFMPITKGADQETSWWDNDWKSRIKVWVNETNGIEQNEFVMDIWVDFSKYDVINATREVRVIHWSDTAEELIEVPVQVMNERNDGVKAFEARVLFSVSGLRAFDNHLYFIYFNNAEATSPSSLYTNFNPDIIKNRIMEPTFENNNYEFQGPSDVVVDDDGIIYVCDRENERVQVYDDEFVHLRTFGTTRESGNDTCHFDHPSGIAVDDDNLYVVDEGNHRVQVFDITGAHVTTLGSTGVSGTGMNQFDHPKDVSVDEEGRLYVTDYNNHRVQVFNDIDDSVADDTIGMGTSGAGMNSFSYPMGIVHSSGKLYVADSGNHRVQVLDTNGDWLSTLGMDCIQGHEDENLCYPYGVSVNDDGYIAVSDYGNHRAQLFTDNGTHIRTFGVSTIFGSGNAYLHSPYNIALNDEEVYIADYGNDRVQVFSISGDYIRTLGGRSPFAIGENDLSGVRSVEVDDDGNIYIGDRGNHRIQVYQSSGAFKYTIGTTGESGEANTHFDKPNDVLVKGGKICVADRSNNRVQIFDMNGTYLNTIGGTSGQGNYQLNNPCGIGMNGEGMIFICDTYNDRVQVFNSNYTYNATIGTGVSDWANGTFRHPYDIEFGTDGMIYILDTDNFRIQVFYPDNYTYSHMLLEGIREVVDGAPLGGGTGTNQLQWACGFDLRGNRIAIADTYNSRVLVMKTDGTYEFTIGFTGTPGSDDYHFTRPRKADIAPNGDIYVADADNNRVQVYRTNGSYLRTIGFSERYTFDNSHLYNPGSVIADESGNMYIVDTNNHRVQIFSQIGEYIDTIGSSTLREAGNDNGHLFVPRGVTIANNQIYIADTGNARVQVFSMAGHYADTVDIDCYSMIKDSQDYLYYIDSPGHAVYVRTADGQDIQTLGVPNEAGNDNTHMNFPQGAGVDESGKIYVADTNNHRILIFNDLSDAVADQTIGITQEEGADIAHFDQPTDVDCFGNKIYITDHNNHRIQIFDSSGGAFSYLTTIGITGMSGSDNVHLRGPTSSSIGSDGKLYISDMENNRIVIITDVEANELDIEHYDSLIQGLPAWTFLIVLLVIASIIILGLLIARKKKSPMTKAPEAVQEKASPVDRGYSYLIDEEKPKRTFEISSSLALIENNNLLLMVRTPPSNLEGEYNIKAKSILWLSRVDSPLEHVESIKPSPLTRVQDKMLSFIENNENPVIVLEGIEYLVSENGFSEVLRLLDSIIPVVATRNGILIVPIDKRTLSTKDYSTLARQMRMLE